MKVSLRDVVTLDFETFYGKGYTLSSPKMNMSEYIRDPRFKIHCVGIKIGNGKTRYYPTNKVEAVLRAIDWSRKFLLCHNTAFDGLILSHHFGIIPRGYLDTLSMARALYPRHLKLNLDSLAKLNGLAGKVKKGALVNTANKRDLDSMEMQQLGEYCCDDVNDTFELFKIFKPHFPEDELELVHITLAMFCDPILRVNHDLTQQEIEQEQAKKEEALAKVSCSRDDLMSNPKFAQELQALGVTPPVKISPRTGKATFAFAKNDLEFQALAKHPDQAVRDLYEARLAVKSTIKETRAVRLANAGSDTLPLPVMLHYCGAHTTRWSGGNKLNLQNLNRPQIDAFGDIVEGTGLLRRAIQAPPGYVIGVADSAQIEARILAWLADQADIVNAFANKQDVYKLMASSIYGKPVDQITKDERFIGKVCVLGLGYGMGAEKLRYTLEQGIMGPSVVLSVEECQRIVSLYRSTNWKIKSFWKQMDRVIMDMFSGNHGELKCFECGPGFIRLPSGLFVQYPDLNVQISEDRNGELRMADAYYITRNGPSKIYGGLLTENIVQAIARCVIGEQMLAVHRAGYRIVSMTHDEIITLLPKKTADRDIKKILQIMSKAPDWAPGLPLAAEGGYDVSYSK
jgi:hypothetical protein